MAVHRASAAASVTPQAAVPVTAASSETAGEGPMDVVHLHGMRLFSYHGFYAEETRKGQPFECDLDLSMPLTEAGESDALAHTVDYGAVHAMLQRILIGPPYLKLLESLSLRCIDQLLLAFPRVHSIRITMRKPQVSLQGLLEYSGVTMERSREQRANALQRLSTAAQSTATALSPQ
jgi:dihydroneopterin aldolase